MFKALRLTNSIVIPFTLIMLAGVTPIETNNTHVTKNMEFEIGYKVIDRVEILENFFLKYKSPLKDNAATFVNVADMYGMDYRLLPAISCMESTCGKFLKEGTYNPFGWGVYGGNHPTFSSYDEAIHIVGEGIHKNYIARGYDTVTEIAPIYTPPNSNNWANGVSWFTNQIDTIANNF